MNDEPINDIFFLEKVGDLTVIKVSDIFSSEYSALCADEIVDRLNEQHRIITKFYRLAHGVKEDTEKLLSEMRKIAG